MSEVIKVLAVMEGSRRDAAELPRKLRSILKDPCLFHIVPNNTVAFEQTKLLWYDLIIQHENSTSDASASALFQQIIRDDGSVPPAIFLRKCTSKRPNRFKDTQRFRFVKLTNDGHIPMLELSSSISALAGSFPPLPRDLKGSAPPQWKLPEHCPTVSSSSPVTTQSTCSTSSRPGSPDLFLPSSFSECSISCRRSEAEALPVASRPHLPKRQRSADSVSSLTSSEEEKACKEDEKGQIREDKEDGEHQLPPLKLLKRPQATYPANFTSCAGTEQNKPSPQRDAVVASFSFPPAVASSLETIPACAPCWGEQREPRPQLFRPIKRQLSAQDLLDRGMLPVLSYTDFDFRLTETLSPSRDQRSATGQREAVLGQDQGDACSFTEAELERAFRCCSASTCDSDLSSSPGLRSARSSCYSSELDDLCMFPLDL